MCWRIYAGRTFREGLEFRARSKLAMSLGATAYARGRRAQRLPSYTDACQQRGHTATRPLERVREERAAPSCGFHTRHNSTSVLRKKKGARGRQSLTKGRNNCSHQEQLGDGPAVLEGMWRVGADACLATVGSSPPRAALPCPVGHSRPAAGVLRPFDGESTRFSRHPANCPQNETLDKNF